MRANTEAERSCPSAANAGYAVTPGITTGIARPAPIHSSLRVHRSSAR
jgi:hypothetical protein